jgi:hypothetical protein
MGRQHGFSEEDYAKARKQSIKADRERVKTETKIPKSSPEVISDVPNKTGSDPTGSSFSKRIQHRLAKVFHIKSDH